MPALTAPVRGALRRLGDRLGATLAAERANWPNWLPVCMGLGIAGYFLAPMEPPLWTGGAVLAAALSLAVLLRGRGLLSLIGYGLLATAVGFAAIVWRSHDVAAPRLNDDLTPRKVAGEVIAVDYGDPQDYRLLLDAPEIAGLAAADTPARIRVNVRIKGELPQPGERVALTAGLLPPPAPAMPGAYDFGRAAWFERLGAVGYAVSAPEVVRETTGWQRAIAAWRQAITLRIRATLDDTEGAVAAALITGDRRGIPESVFEALRLSGLAHLLAISGLHLGLVAGIVFFSLRAGMAAVPRLALYYPIKKWAALGAIAAAGFYTLLAGTPLPTERAFLMTGLVLVAVMLDRTALTMRLVAVAATAILLFKPEVLLSISFQMSFAAVVALVAFYEAVRNRRQGDRQNHAPRWMLYFMGLAATTVVASLAIAPFAAFHFNRMVNYELLANLAAVPIVALWVMPWAVTAMLLMPLGLEALALHPMGWGIRGVIEVAETVSNLPGAVVHIPGFSPGALVLIGLGGLWLALWRTRWRLFGLVPVLLGLGAAYATATPPDILIGPEGDVVAIKTPKGGLAFSNRGGSGFMRSTWLENAGRQRAMLWSDLLEGSATPGRWLQCDGWGCVYRRHGLAVAILRAREAAPTDCRRADFVIAPFPLPSDCRLPLGAVDRYDLWGEGVHALWLENGAVRIDSVRTHQGHRPWRRRPGQ